MKLSAVTVAVARVALAKEIQHGNRDPRLRAAFVELRKCLMEDDTRALIEASREVALCRKQA